MSAATNNLMTGRHLYPVVGATTTKKGLYKLKNKAYPTTEQGLEALVNKTSIEPIPRRFPEGGFIEKLPEDPWGNPYQLISPGEIGKVDIFSMGPDGEAGTDDDIGNWDEEKQ